MMSREFTSREKLLLLILCVLLLGIVYYQFVVKAVDETIQKYDTAELETDLLIEQTKAENILSMEKEMKSLRTQSKSRVPSYNNIKALIGELNDIFAAASTYNFNFNQAMKEGDAVRRDVNISFTAGTYSGAESIIEKLADCRYRCLIRDISISTGSEGGIGSGSVSVSMTATFFETMYNANTEDGLEESNNEGNTTTENETK